MNNAVKAEALEVTGKIDDFLKSEEGRHFYQSISGRVFDAARPKISEIFAGHSAVMVAASAMVVSKCASDEGDIDKSFGALFMAEAFLANAP